MKDLKEKKLRLLEQKLEYEKNRLLEKHYYLTEYEHDDKLDKIVVDLQESLSRIEKEFNKENIKLNLYYDNEKIKDPMDYIHYNHGLKVYNKYLSFIEDCSWLLKFIKQQLEEGIDKEELTEIVVNFINGGLNPHDWIKVDKEFAIDYFDKSVCYSCKSAVFIEKESLVEEFIERLNVKEVYEIELIEDKDNKDLLNTLVETVKGDEVNKTIVVIKNAVEAIFDKESRLAFLTFLNNVCSNKNIIIFFTCRDLYELKEYYGLANIHFGVCEDVCFYNWNI